MAAHQRGAQPPQALAPHHSPRGRLKGGARPSRRRRSPRSAHTRRARRVLYATATMDTTVNASLSHSRDAGASGALKGAPTDASSSSEAVVCGSFGGLPATRAKHERTLRRDHRSHIISRRELTGLGFAEVYRDHEERIRSRCERV